jgi:hypothetical protein
MTTTTTTTSSRSGLPSLGLQNSHAGRRATTRAVQRQRQISSRRQLRQVVVRAESKDDAENKDTLGNLDAILSSSQDEGQPPAQDEQPKTEDDGFFERQAMSDAQKKKLREEYLSFGGSANTAMGGNYYLYIIVAISALAVAAKLTGALD